MRLYLNNVFEVRVKSKTSVRRLKTPFRSTNRLSPLTILHNHGRNDVDVDRVITLKGGRGRVDAPLPPHDCM